MGRRRWPGVLRGVAAGVLALALLAVLAVVAVSEWLLRRPHDVPVAAFPAHEVRLPDDAAARDAEGRRRAVLIGCLEGCHGPEGEGGVEAAPGIFSATAPTLPAVLPDYSVAELARLVRFGVRRDGRSAVGMPAGTFYALSEEDLVLIFEHLRGRPSRPAVARRRSVEPLGRLALVLGTWRLSADQVDRQAPRWGELPRDSAFERGRYWAAVICSECHGLDLGGDATLASPPLAVVGAYDLPAFERLLREGVHLSGRTTGLMSRVARAAFVEFTDGEIADLHAFLRARVEESGDDRGLRSLGGAPGTGTDS